jgi:putative oxidoreductase
MEVLNLLTHGPDAADVGVFVSRAAVGVFFGISGYHKLFNAERHARLKRTLEGNNIPMCGFMEWWVPGWELVSGALLTVGLFTSFNAIVLAIICLVACSCEAAKKVAGYNPIDAADVVDDYLYLPEVLYIVLLSTVVLVGPGAFSLDKVFF